MIEVLPPPHMVPSMARIQDYEQLTYASMRTDGELGLTIKGVDTPVYIVEKLSEEVFECFEPSEADGDYSRLQVLNGIQASTDQERLQNHQRELGDVLWCLTRSLGTLGSNLQQAASWLISHEEVSSDGTFEQIDVFIDRQSKVLASTETMRELQDETALFLVSHFAVFWLAAQRAISSREQSEAMRSQLAASGGILLGTLGWIAHNRFGITLEEVAQQNAYKVCVRNANGSVFGNGDSVDR